MFSGAWAESSNDLIEMNITDPNITEESLHVALGSLYQDEVTVEPAKVIPVLAAATLLQLEGLITQSRGIMRESTNMHTVVPFYDAAKMYGTRDVEEVKKRTWI